jgi:hypothetical protein
MRLAMLRVQFICAGCMLIMVKFQVLLAKIMDRDSHHMNSCSGVLVVAEEVVVAKG